MIFKIKLSPLKYINLVIKKTHKGGKVANLTFSPVLGWNQTVLCVFFKQNQLNELGEKAGEL